LRTAIRPWVGAQVRKALPLRQEGAS
jgi:hypothetical protein